MSSTKRRSLKESLQRRVRARREPSEVIEFVLSGQSSNEEGPNTEGDGSVESDKSDEDDKVSISRPSK